MNKTIKNRKNATGRTWEKQATFSYWRINTETGEKTIHQLVDPIIFTRVHALEEINRLNALADGQTVLILRNS